VTAELSVLHWNVHSWKDAAGEPNADQVTALIRDTGPDVVSLVEVNEPWGSPATLTSIAAACGYRWVFVPCISYGGRPDRRGYGNALLSRVPIAAVQQVEVFAAAGGYVGPEESETRSAVFARTDSGFWAGATHFPANLRTARKTAAAALIDVLGQLGTPWIVAGDFNAAPSALFTGRTDLLRVYPSSGEATFPAHRPRVAIDYFLTSPDVAVTAEVLRVPGSDHLPVFARCSFLARLSERFSERFLEPFLERFLKWFADHQQDVVA
jgi:endonuclease/exonuclease/phosphatase family metal-dependent hydrolase